MKYLITLTFLLLPVLALAAPTYTPLVGLPGVDPDDNFDVYINALYVLSISIAALLAVIKIVIAGVKYMLTDIVTTKGEAKNDIYSALLGLLVVLGAVLILTIINPNLTKVDIAFPSVGKSAGVDISTENVDRILAAEQILTQQIESMDAAIAWIDSLPSPTPEQLAAREDYIQAKEGLNNELAGVSSTKEIVRDALEEEINNCTTAVYTHTYWPNCDYAGGLPVHQSTCGAIVGSCCQTLLNCEP